jgi:formylglycine-generating enzyme required for sulfatase activity
MSDKQEETKKQNVQADDQSVAIGSIDVGGNVSGNITIGHTIGYTADDVSVLIDQITSTFQPKPFDGRCPYKGLDVFEEEDAELFFGREKIVEDLVKRVKGSRTVYITGPSGSGKSSLIRAGLIPALKRGELKNSERWLYETVKPGRDPVEALALAFSRLKSPELGKYFRKNVHQSSVLHECAESALSGQKDQRLVLFFDQFEEVFTQVGHEESRAAFLDLLTYAALVEDGRVIILFAMRSDFVSNCATYPELNALLNQQFVQIGAMGADELVSAIAQPALRVGLRIDPDLVAQIINDMQGEPGALPLMQFALKDLFEAEQTKGGMIALTREAYLQRGGIQKSLERHADTSFEKLNLHEQELARSIFGGLIEIGRGTQDTRRTALFDELIPASASVEEIKTIVRKLADERLITTDELAGKDMVTISHEKLIEAWPWLKKLVNENRDVIALQNQIATDTKEWEDRKRDPSYLYSGARLANVREQLEMKKLTLNGLAQEFVRAGSLRQRNSKITFFVTGGVILLLVAIITYFVYPRIAEERAKKQALEEMILIQGGNMKFGTDDKNMIDLGFVPLQEVNLQSFYIGKYEVTNRQYKLCVKYGDCPIPWVQDDYRDPDKEDYPVVYITLYHANTYCRWAGQRLITELEWERATRGQNGRTWPWGEDAPTPDYVNMPALDASDPTEGLQPAISNPRGMSPNPELVYNLVGNVWEWTSSYVYEGGEYNMEDYWNGNLENLDGTRFYSTRGGSWEKAIMDTSQSSPASLGTIRRDLGFRCGADVTDIN